jgi:hypothetical protein
MERTWIVNESRRLRRTAPGADVTSATAVCGHLQLWVTRRGNLYLTDDELARLATQRGAQDVRNADIAATFYRTRNLPMNTVQRTIYTRAEQIFLDVAALAAAEPAVLCTRRCARCGLLFVSLARAHRKFCFRRCAVQAAIRRHRARRRRLKA